MKLDHVAISVTNIQNSIDWYVKEFNALVEYHDTTWAMMNISGTKIALIKSNYHKPHIAFTQDAVSPPEDAKTHRDGSKYIYTEDPDGNMIEKIWW